MEWEESGVVREWSVRGEIGVCNKSVERVRGVGRKWSVRVKKAECDGGERIECVSGVRVECEIGVCE